MQINVSMFVSGWKWQSGIKDGLLPSPAVLQIVSVREEKPDRKKKKKNPDEKKGKNRFTVKTSYIFSCLHLRVFFHLLQQS